MSFSVKTISIIVAANVKGLEKGMGKANKSLANFASGAARMGSLLTFSVTAPLAALGKTAVDTFAEFEDSMMKVNVVTGATQEEFGLLQKEAKRLGQETRFTARQFADLQLILGRKGFDPSQIIAMEEAIAKLALATGEDLSLAAETVSASLKAFNLDADESSRVANTLAQAAATSSIQLSTFATAFGHAGSSAKAVGVTIERLSAMMGVLMDNGIKASKAGTGLRKIFSKLNEVGVPFEETLRKMASGQMTLNDATKLVGETASNQLLILSNNLDKVDELTEGYKNNTTALDEMAAKMDETTKGKLAKFNSALETFKITAGELLIEMLMPFIETLTELTKEFSNLDKETQKQIVQFGLIAAVVGPLLLLAAALAPVFAAIGTALSAVGSVIASVAGAFTLAEIAAAALAAAYFEFLGIAKEADKELAQRNKLLKQNSIILSDNGTALTNLQKLHSEDITNNKEREKAQKKLNEQLKIQNKFLEEQKKNIGATVSLKTGDSGTQGLRGGRPDMSQLPDQAMVSLFGYDLGFTEEQIVNLNNEIVNMFTNFSDGFVNLFDKQTKFVEINGEMVEVTMSFGEKFGNFVSDFLIGITKMIAKTAILAGLLSLVGLGNVVGGPVSGFKGIFKSLLSGGIMGFADGGRPPVGKMSLVGERGPELFVPGSSGTIIPNHALGGGGAAAIPDVRISGNDLLIVFNKSKRRKNFR